MDNATLRTAGIAVLFATSSINAFAASGTVSNHPNDNELKQCIPMELADPIHDNYLIAALTNSVSGIASTSAHSGSGITLDMEHYFINTKSAMMRTSDKATLSKIAGKDATYMIEMNHHVKESSGALAGYKGDFSSVGLFNINEGKVMLRYQGELCK